MPTWQSIWRTFDSIRNRYQLQRPIGEMLTGIIPTLEVDRHWPVEQLDFYGLNILTDSYNTFFVADGNAHHLYCELQAPDDLEVLVWSVEATAAQNTGAEDDPLHLFTPLQGYATLGNPPPNGLEGNLVNPFLAFPWLQPINPGDSGRLSSTYARAGATEGLQTVVVSGVPTTAIGPMMRDSRPDGIPMQASKFKIAWSASYRPPLRIKPGERLAVQTAIALTNLNRWLEVNFLYSERPYEPGR